MIIDVYAGPGGWTQGLSTLGLTDIGIELDPSACATRTAAGHQTIRADAATFPLDHLTGLVDGLIMSPPCQAFSIAGKGAGRDALDQLVASIRSGDWTGPAHDDDRIRHVLEVGRWAETLHPTWIACEQVPPVLPLWQAYAERWRTFGWSTWAGILNAADFGVPQTRRRAFLIARTDGRPVAPPEPTHCQGGSSTLFGGLTPWVSMADALGWGETWQARKVMGAGMVERHGNRPARPATEPAFTIRSNAGGAAPGGFVLDRRQQPDGTAPIKLTVRDALILQGFPPDYPVQGTRTAQFRQVGDAVPPPLAAAVVNAATWLTRRKAVA